MLYNIVGYSIGKRNYISLFYVYLYRPKDVQYRDNEKFMVRTLTNITLTLDKPNTISQKTKGDLIESVESFATWPALKQTTLEIRTPADIDPIILQKCEYHGIKDFVMGKHKTQTCSKKENAKIKAEPDWAIHW